METPSSSDFLEVKKRKEYPIENPERNASSYITNKQYLILQKTASVDYDYVLEPSTRFQIPLPRNDLATIVFPNQRTFPMFSFRSNKT